MLEGKLFYRERIALPPNGTAKITLDDTTVADRQAPVVAAKTIELADRQVPIPFELSIARDKLQPQHDYGLRATIHGPQDKLLWTTDQTHLINLEQNRHDFGMLRLVRVEAAASDGAGLSSGAGGNVSKQSLLIDREWVVEDIAERGIIDASHMTLNFDANGRLSGYAGCNNYHAQYELAGESLRVDTMAVTMKACAPALNNQERRFLQVLRDTHSFDIDATGKLILHSANGDTLAAYPATSS
ncbi:MAG TPA: META domain-containing protein [Salinisphaeraceae bacterium]|nr:META domain-containing protein [Salinisphaeraceae bacterium]